MSTVTKSLLAFTAFLFLLPAAASAQDQRFRVSFAPSVAALGGDAELALSGMVAYRFSEHFWFEGDVTWLDAAAGGLRDRRFRLRGSDRERQRPGRDHPAPRRQLRTRPARAVASAEPADFPGYGNRSSATADGSTFIGTVGVRYELPGQTARFRPYLSGGLGINNTDQELRIEPFGIDASTRAPAMRSTPARGPVCASPAACGPTWTRNTSGSRAIATSCGSAEASASGFRRIGSADLQVRSADLRVKADLKVGPTYGLYIRRRRWHIAPNYAPSFTDREVPGRGVRPRRVGAHCRGQRAAGRIQPHGQQRSPDQRRQRAPELAADERRLRVDALLEAHPDQSRQREKPADGVGARARRHAGRRAERARERGQPAHRQRLHVHDRRLGHRLQDRRAQPATRATTCGSPIPASSTRATRRARAASRSGKIWCSPTCPTAA